MTAKKKQKKSESIAPKVYEFPSMFWNENCAVCNKLGECEMEPGIRKAKDGGDLKILLSHMKRIGDKDCAEIAQGVEHVKPKENEAAEMAKELSVVMEKMALDHERLARIESMLQFMLEKNGIEVNRKLLPGEKVKGVGSRVLYRRSWWQEWSEAWKKKLEERQKAEEANGEKESNS